MNLKPYQERALGELIEKVGHFSDSDGKGELCIFKAPTGSGKTVVMAEFIDQFIKRRPKEDLCFIWISVGTGELHIQSRDVLREVFGGAPKVSLIEEEFGGGKKEIERNEVVVASWQILARKNRDGQWSAILMRDGEQVNFREVLSATQAKKRKIILIVDESHIAAGAPRAMEVRELISPDVVIEMSATPSMDREGVRTVDTVEVDPADVIRDGMIKREIVINPGFDEAARHFSRETESQEMILELAFQKREELKKLYRSEKSSVNPLMLIQVPNAKEGELKVEFVLNFLDKKGAKKDEGVAIWMSDEKTLNLDSLKNLDDKTDFLIFKQAVAVGWDCPRAHILVKLREPANSETFEIQTVGRILRMPERRHYENEDLNVGYIYSNSSEIKVDPTEYVSRLVKHLPAKRIKEYKDIKLQSYYHSRTNYGDITATFAESFEEAAKQYFGFSGGYLAANRKLIEKKGIKLSAAEYIHSIVADAGIDAKEFDSLSGRIRGASLAQLRLHGQELEAKFYGFLESNLGNFGNKARSVPRLANIIYAWFEEYLDAKKWKQYISTIHGIVTDSHNQKHFERLIGDAIKLYEEVKSKELHRREKEGDHVFEFEIPLIDYFNQETDEKVPRMPRCVLQPCYLSRDRSGPERAFEDFLEDQGEKLLWWWKNGDGSQKYFGIAYSYEGIKHTFYPDYLVAFKDGNIGIFETKDEGDQDGSTRTKAKAEALAGYVAAMNKKGKNLLGGIVIKKGDFWNIHSGKKYAWDKCLRGDWSDWQKLDFDKK